ncbi:MAG: RNA-binding protein [candidate division Zixibacteria bacterium]|nr:RNA-binding protein [candidate division Zixibacteria bacterium]
MNIFVGNLSFDAGEDDLSQLFEQHGEVSSAKVIRDRLSGRSRGFAFIEMPDDGAAQSAIDELNGTDLKGRQINVNQARPRENRTRDGGGGGRRNRY